MDMRVGETLYIFWRVESGWKLNITVQTAVARAVLGQYYTWPTHGCASPVLYRVCVCVRAGICNSYAGARVDASGYETYE